MRPIMLEKDQALCCQGDRVASAYFVVAGSLQEQHREGRSGSAQQYLQGDCVGEACLFVPPGTHYHLKLSVVTTAWRNELLELTRDGFSHEIKRLVPPLYDHLVKSWRSKETEERWLGFEKVGVLRTPIADTDEDRLIETADV